MFFPKKPTPGWTCLLFAGALFANLPATGGAADLIVFRHRGAEKTLPGKVLVTTDDGGILFLAPDGQIWPVQADEIVSRTETADPFALLGPEEHVKQLLSELPAGFEVHTTANYLICYNTSRAYAQWCGALFERLQKASLNFWSRKGFAVRAPAAPLVVLVFADAASYRQFAKRELGDSAKNIVGYYSLQSNRVTMYDLTGAESLRTVANRRGSLKEINAMLSRPEAEPMVATVVHEATHQIAFNSGLQTRYAEIPLWVSEGIAVYFETPDLKSSKGWSGIGEINRPRLAVFQKNLPGRPAGGLGLLVAEDERLRDSKAAIDAYAEAWALTYYLIRQRPQQYLAYLKMLSEKSPLVPCDKETRLKEFEAIFGDIPTLDAEFVRSMGEIR